MQTVHSSNLSIVLLLGEFHTMMNFARNIGALMPGSGLETALEFIYSKVTVFHLLLGKQWLRGYEDTFSSNRL